MQLHAAHHTGALDRWIFAAARRFHKSKQDTRSGPPDLHVHLFSAVVEVWSRVGGRSWELVEVLCYCLFVCEVEVEVEGELSYHTYLRGISILNSHSAHVPAFL